MNPEQKANINKKRREHRKAKNLLITNNLWYETKTCFYCKRNLVSGELIKKKKPTLKTIDFIKPLNKKGEPCLNNLAICCLTCNHKRNHIDTTHGYKNKLRIFKDYWLEIYDKKKRLHPKFLEYLIF